MLKRVLKWAAGVLLVLIVAFVVFVGPWPQYGASDVETEPYFKKVVASIEEHAKHSSYGETPGRLNAGWGKAILTPAIGTPLAGYGDREGKPSTGVHDDVCVRALALSDGKDTAVLVGSDMLIVPDNVANLVRQRVSAEAGLTADDILFNASHTHSGPGAWGPGAMAYMFAGTYNEQIVSHLADAFAAAIVQAVNEMKPAELAFGDVDAPQYIRNRVRDAGTDPELNYLIVKNEEGKTCHVVSYGAHATVLGGGNMEFSADYPGYLVRTIEKRTGGFAMFLSGAVGSMSPRIDGADGFSRAQALGEALATLIADDEKNATFSTMAEIGSIGFAFTTPSLQLRPPFAPKWRISPFLVKALGVDDVAWMQGVRVGSAFFFATPCDMSGEISHETKQWANARGIDLWMLSFGGDYVGYVSPQKYYATADPSGDEQYEMYIMSWIGPNMEPLFTQSLEHMVDVMMPVVGTPDPA